MSSNSQLHYGAMLVLVALSILLSACYYGSGYSCDEECQARLRAQHEAELERLHRECVLIPERLGEVIAAAMLPRAWSDPAPDPKPIDNVYFTAVRAGPNQHVVQGSAVAASENGTPNNHYLYLLVVGPLDNPSFILRWSRYDDQFDPTPGFGSIDQLPARVPIGCSRVAVQGPYSASQLGTCLHCFWGGWPVDLAGATAAAIQKALALSERLSAQDLIYVAGPSLEIWDVWCGTGPEELDLVLGELAASTCDVLASTGYDPPPTFLTGSGTASEIEGALAPATVTFIEDRDSVIESAGDAPMIAPIKNGAGLLTLGVLIQAKGKAYIAVDAHGEGWLMELTSNRSGEGGWDAAAIRQYWAIDDGTD